MYAAEHPHTAATAATAATASAAAPNAAADGTAAASMVTTGAAASLERHSEAPAAAPGNTERSLYGALAYEMRTGHKNGHLQDPQQWALQGPASSRESSTWFRSSIKSIISRLPWAPAPHSQATQPQQDKNTTDPTDWVKVPRPEATVEVQQQPSHTQQPLHAEQLAPAPAPAPAPPAAGLALPAAEVGPIAALAAAEAETEAETEAKAAQAEAKAAEARGLAARVTQVCRPQDRTVGWGVGVGDGLDTVSKRLRRAFLRT